ncbi:MAG: hypothetical protein QGD91_12525, partial [Actinomycetota bacterium]|nr:hypothetical protein [Actinomycetota bacterium]
MEQKNALIILPQYSNSQSTKANSNYGQALNKTATAGQAVVLGYVDDSAESKRSIAGSGHAVVF